MCGIFGFSFKPGRLSDARRAVLATNLARYNDERGGHSWGVVGFDQDGPKISRGLGDLSDHVYALCEYNTFFAHTRFATHGEPSIRNAHPFKIGKIIGAHNGVIFNHGEICRKYRRPYVVDSMHLFAHLNKDIPFNDLEGYGAIEWVDLDHPNRINLSKLRDGELAVYGIGTHNNLDALVWSSSYKHLQKSLFCAGVDKFVKYDIKIGRQYYIENNVFHISRGKRLELSAPEEMSIDPEEMLMSNEDEPPSIRKPFQMDMYRQAYCIG